MRYRALDENGDMTFGHGSANFLIDSPAAVAQSALTRLRLFAGEWYLNDTEGTPYSTQILGKYTEGTYDAALRDRIVGTQGVLELLSYSSVLENRRLSVDATVSTIYGDAQVTGAL